MNTIKRLPFLVGILACISFMSIQGDDDLADRGGGRGGGGRGGGGGGGRAGGGGGGSGRASQAVQHRGGDGRSPSMSRANPNSGNRVQQAQRPANSQAQVQQYIHNRQNGAVNLPSNTGNRPNINQPGGNTGNRPDFNRPNNNLPGGNAGNRPEFNRPDFNRPNINQPGGNIGNRPNNVNRPQGSVNQQNIDASLNVFRQNNSEASSRVSQAIKNYNPGYNNWFDGNFFNNHRINPPYYNSGYSTWGSAGWGTVSSWLPYEWSYPIYYGDQGDVIALPPESESYASAGPAPDTSSDWLPLGVFATGKTAEQAAISNLYVQLALNKQGEIAGTYYNAGTDQTRPLNGMVDKESQQAVWQISDNPNSPIMVTGLYNLTQDAAIIQVNFADGTVQSWTFIRINPGAS